MFRCGKYPREVDNLSEAIEVVEEWKFEARCTWAPSTHLFILTGPVLWLASTRMHFAGLPRQPVFIPGRGHWEESSGQDIRALFLPSFCA